MELIIGYTCWKQALVGFYIASCPGRVATNEMFRRLGVERRATIILTSDKMIIMNDAHWAMVFSHYDY